ncbi:unnamed protein product [Allacma fusca]|uniref:MYND-type domain-containing protein n=1 Tax=Allacma fusca TaxID=39272 RepID=A0A8J2LEP1_9HEXA|nr:unnamed protein product [Allacma fusca]
MEGKCAVCSLECSKFCSSCKKVYYCSVGHQKSDRKKHRKNCFPAAILVDEIQGRYFAATKSIVPGDCIFNDKALVVGPTGAEKKFHKICLGCYRVVKGNYSCSKCRWPVCSQICEKLPPHCDAECKIFASRNVGPYFTKPYEYDFIKFLRSLLVRESDEKRWDQLCQLASHPEARGKCEASVLATMASYEFITEICGLQQFDYDTVNHIVGVWGINSFGANAPTGPNPTGRLASFLFPKTSLCSHNCIANTHGILMEEEEDVKIPDSNVKIKRPIFTMQLLASRPIEEGKPIFITYAEVGEGTFERQKILRENYYFQCKCDRCKDPTEFGSFFSGYKCLACKSGYLLPGNYLDADCDWKCSSGSELCPVKKYPELVTPLIRIKYDLNSVGMNDTENEIKRLEKILADNSGKTLHPNHWLLMEVEFRLIQRLICFMPEAKNVNAVIRKCILYGQHCLDVADIIRPGHNPYRGKILYCLCQAKLQGIVRSTSDDVIEKRASLSNLKSGVEEAQKILSKEPPGSDERIIADSLNEDLVQIQRIITVLDVKLKNGIRK